MRKRFNGAIVLNVTVVLFLVCSLVIPPMNKVNSGEPNYKPEIIEVGNFKSIISNKKDDWVDILEVEKQRLEEYQKRIEIYESYGEWKDYMTRDIPEVEFLGVYELTAYCSCASCCGSETRLTASGTHVLEGRTVAINGIPFGTTVYIEGIGYRIVEDTGNMPSNVIDVYMESHQRALDFGRLKDVNVYVIK